MPVTVLNEDSATIVSDADDQPKRFSWSAAFAGAFVAAGVTFALMTLGSGIGLSLVTVRHATPSGTATFLTLGAVYFLAAQAFGFAAGGHVVGRLIGPALETSREEDFRAGTHGLVAWAIAVVATATVVAASVLVAGSAASNGALASTAAAHGDTTQAAATSYWVDRLFRPATYGPSASLAGLRYAQNDTGATTDVPATGEPTALTPGESATSSDAPSANAGSGVFLQPGGAETTPVTTTPLSALRPLGADKAEAGRILTVGMANGEALPGEDRSRLAGLVSSDTGLANPSAERRVDEVANRIHADEIAAADAARKTAAMVSLWTALALLFGAVVAVFAAVSARWEDDRELGLRPAQV